MLSGQRASRLLALCGGALVMLSCSSGPPTQPAPVTPTPTPAPTVAACTASAPQPMTSFKADPATITDGDSFTLRWTAPCGFVTLAQKGKSPFMTLLPSTGSYALRPGLDGYPSAPERTVYEARNADTATPLDATVTMNPAPTTTPTPGGKATPTPTPVGTVTPPPTPTPPPPTVSLSAVSGPSCHPPSPGTPCTVSFTASATGYTSLAWSGCCTGSAGVKGACKVSDITSTFTCSVTATGAGGTASADAVAHGVNSPPSVGAVTYSPPEPLLENNYINATPATHDPDGDAVNCASVSVLSGPCYAEGCSSSGATVVLHTTTASGTCNWQATWVDTWGASTTQTYAVLVQ